MASMADIKTTNQLHQFAAEQHRDEPNWLMNRRLHLADTYLALPLPVRQRTPLKNRKLDRIPILTVQPDALASDSLTELLKLVNLAMVNGRVVQIAIPQSWKDKGVILLSMKDAVQSVPQLVQEYLGTVINDEVDKFQALNGALWQDGLFVYIPPRVALDEPITVMHYGDAQATSILPRNLIIADKESSVVIVEQYLSEPGAAKSLWSAATEIVLKEGAVMHYGAIQQLAPAAEVFVRRGCTVGRDAVVNWHIGEFGAGLVVSEHLSILGEPGGKSESTTVFFGSSNQHQDYTAIDRHIAPHTTSRMVARGVMKNEARSVFTGITDIKKGAVGSDGRQKEKILMLSDTARADAIPSLLIEENDVFAAHAASAGPVDEATIFYLMSRGLSKPEAVRLIVQGFLAPVIDAIPLGPLRQDVWNAVERKIAQ